MAKNYLLLLITVGILLSCNKNDDTQPQTNTNGSGTNNSTVPSQFTQKVLMEQFTGAWNGACPDGIYKMQTLMNSNSNLIGVCIHEGDAMEIPQFTSLMGTFNNNQLPLYPSAFISRTSSANVLFLNKLQWLSNTTVIQNKTAPCGLAIESSVNGSTLQVTIHSGFCQPVSGDLRLNVYIIENEIQANGTGYSQTNTNSYNDPSSPYFNAGSPIPGYKHNNVLRKVLTNSLGNTINPSNAVPDSKQTDSFTVDISGINVTKAKIIAFISKNGNSPLTHQVLNVQSCALNQFKNWD